MNTDQASNKNEYILPFVIFWINRKPIFEILGLIIFPLIILYEGLKYFMYEAVNLTASSVLNISSEIILGIAYILMMMFVSAFALSITSSKKDIITRKELFKLFPYTFRKTILVTGSFVFATILLKNILFIFVLFIPLFVPAITIITLYQEMPKRSLIKESRIYLKSSEGRIFLKKAAILFIVLLVLGLTVITIISSIIQEFLTVEAGIIFQILKSSFVIFLFMILYFHMNYYYTEEPFILKEELKIDIETIFNRKPYKNRYIKSGKKEKSPKSESNRFKQKDESNRFLNY